MEHKLKTGDLIVVSFQNALIKGIYIRINPESLHYRAVPYWLTYSDVSADSSNFAKKRIKDLESGKVKLGRIDYIISDVKNRVLPISEDVLSPLEARYIKLYRSNLNNEYKNNRSGHTL
jgi:hypothetical protein